MPYSIQTASVVAPVVSAGKLRYANNSNYKNDVMIRKEVSLHLVYFSLCKCSKILHDAIGLIHWDGWMDGQMGRLLL